MSGWRRLMCVMLILHLAAMCSLAAEEEPLGTSGDSLDVDFTCNELAGKKVRLRTLDQTETEGELVWCYGDSLYVAHDSGTHTVFSHDIDSLWVRGNGNGKRTEKSILLGALVGGLIGGLAAELRVYFCEGACGENTTTLGGVLYGALIGGLLGGIFGAASDGESNEWNLWYGSDGQMAYGLNQRRSGIAVGFMLTF